MANQRQLHSMARAVENQERAKRKQAKPLIKKGQSLLKAGEYEEAAELAREALSRDPGSKEAKKLLEQANNFAKGST